MNECVCLRPARGGEGGPCLQSALGDQARHISLVPQPQGVDTILGDDPLCSSHDVFGVLGSLDDNILSLVWVLPLGIDAEKSRHLLRCNVLRHLLPRKTPL